MLHNMDGIRDNISASQLGVTRPPWICWSGNGHKPPRTEAPPDQSPLVLGGLLSGGALVRGIMSYTHAGQVNYTVYTAGRRASARFNASRPRNNVIDTLLPLKRVSSSTIKYVLYRWWNAVSVQCIDNISVDKASRVRYRAAYLLLISHICQSNRLRLFQK